MMGMIIGILLSISFVYAFFEDSVSVTNHIAMGDINIGITEYEMKNGREVLYENSKIVFPGDVISKIPRISNYANDCWIRVKISASNDHQELDGIGVEHLVGMTENWILRGDYFYYNQVLGLKESVDLFQELIIPSEWNEQHSSQKLGVMIQAEAIQAANFKPDFTAMSPWGNQEIEMCVHEAGGIVECVKEEMMLSVEFNGTAHKLLAVPNNFFHNIKRAMPGDYYEDEIILLNTTDENAELYFRSEVAEQTTEQIELLEKIQLEIGVDSKILYQGNLIGKDLAQDISLGNYKPDEEGTLYFKLKIPEELNNAYALREANVTWIFSVKEEGDIEDDSINASDSNDKTAVKTGDETPVLMWIIVGILSVGTIFTGIKRKKEEKKYEK